MSEEQENYEKTLREAAERQLRVEIGLCNHDPQTPADQITVILHNISAAGLDEITNEILLKTLAKQTRHGIASLRKQFAGEQKTRRRGPSAFTDPAALVDEFNKNFFIVNDGGKIVVMRYRHDPVMKRDVIERIQFADFRKMHGNRRVDGVEVAKLWLTHPDRKQYMEGVTFAPEKKVPKGWLNLWQGYGFKSAPGDWSLLRKHIKHVVCNGNEVYYKYLLNWIARMLQHPEIQGEVAVVFRGAEGAGKGIVGRWVYRLCGQHGMQINSPAHLVGRFNSHLRDCIVLFADEAFFAGDKQHASVLRAIITEPTLMIEGKGENAVVCPNMLHVIMASNSDWVVPASHQDRRYFVLDVPDTKLNKHDYFKAIDQQMENGGAAAMLYDLLKRDLSKFEVRKVPQTDALKKQKVLSLDTLDRWWLECLERGFVWRSKHGIDKFREWQEWYATELLNRSYLQWCEKNKVQRPAHRTQVGSRMAEMYQDHRASGVEIIGEVEAATKTMTGINNITFLAGDLIEKKDRPTGYTVNAIDAARERFAAVRGVSGDWTARL